MKKFMSVLISLLLIFVSAVPVFSADAESEAMQKVLVKVKGRIGPTESYSDFHSNVSTNGVHDIYNFSWSDDDKNLNVTASSDGIITSYRYYDIKKTSEASNVGPSINKMRSGEAIEKAKVLIRELNPDIADDIRIIGNTPSESIFNTNYTFEIQRMENGIDVVGDRGYITVNSAADAIESFRITYTPDISFEKSDTVIDVESAKSAFTEKLGLRLQYVCEGDKAVLEYVPAKSNEYICAFDGEPVSPVLPVYPMFKNESAMDTMVSGGGGSAYRQLTEAELRNAEALENLISKEAGENILRSNMLLSVSDSMKLSYFNTSYHSHTKTYCYSYEFAGESENVSATINAVNGELQSYSYYNGKYEQVTGDQTDLALSIVEKLAPEHYKSDDSLEYRFSRAQNGSYTFSRFVNGIECISNSISLTLNSDNKISHYYINHDDVEFESTDGILTEAEACNKLFELCGYKLYYYPTCSKEDANVADKALLVYDFESGYLTLDAKEGKLKAGVDAGPVVGAYTDISGHYAENIIRTLAEFGIGFEETEFRPDDLITQEDYVVLITSALIGNEGIVLSKSDTDYSYYYNRACTERIIVPEDEKSPDAGVSREQAAVYMIRALNLDEVASLDGIYVSEFSDVISHKGHISILGAMGVVNGYGGIFNPGQMLTRADAMIMLYNYLSK